MANDSSIDPTNINNMINKSIQSNGSEQNIRTIEPKPIVTPELKTEKKVTPKVESKENKITINTADFAAKITNKVNKTVRKKEAEAKAKPVVNSAQEIKTVKPAEKPVSIKSEQKDSKAETSKAAPKKSDYVTDDQFFDDFFADDDDE